MRALIADIIKHAARLSGISAHDICGKSRLRHIVRVRQAVYLIAREQMRSDEDGVIHAYSFPQIGAALGDRDHSTIVHGCETARFLAMRDEVFSQFVAELRAAAATGTIFSYATGLSAVFAPSRPAPKPATVEMERYRDAGSVFTLDHNGDCREGRNSLSNMITASQQLVAAIELARAA